MMIANAEIQTLEWIALLKINKKNIFLIALPLALLGLILCAQSRKPRLLPGVGGNVTAIAFSPDGQKIVCASNNNYVQIWLPEKEKWRSFYSPETNTSGQPGLCVRLRFTSDGKTLFAGGSSVGGTSMYSQAWDTVTRRRKFAFNPTSNPVFDVSSDGKFAAMAYKKSAYLIDLQAKPEKISQEKYRHPKDARFIRPHNKMDAEGGVTCVAFSPDSKTLVVGASSQSPISLLSVESGKQVKVIAATASTGTLTFLEWSPDGKLLAATGNVGLTIYDIEMQSARTAAWPIANLQVNQSAAYMGGIVPIAWSPDGKTIFTGGDEVRRWRASDLKLEYSYGVPGPIAISPDGRNLATASWPEPAGPKGVLLWKLGW